MLQDQIKHLAWLVALLLMQALLFRHIHLMGYATPMVYVLFAANLRLGTGRAESLLWCFFMGLTVDLFTLTPGLAAAAMTAVGLIQPRLLQMMVPKDALEDCTPTFSSLGTWRYIQYLIILIMVHHVVFFAIETCTIAHWQDSLLRMVSSAVLTLLLTLPIAKISQ